MRKLLAVLMLLTSSAWASQEYVSYARSMESLYSLPSGLLESICYTESHWRNVPGQHGELGVCQVKPDTVRVFCKNCERPHKYVVYGEVSDRVVTVQAALKDLGYYSGTIDGIYGPITHRAITGYQKARGLQADGVVGPNTWKALFGHRMPAQTIEEQLVIPKMNIEYAARYLVYLREYLGTDNRYVLSAAYNGGPANPVVRYLVRIYNNEKDLLELSRN